MEDRTGGGPRRRRDGGTTRTPHRTTRGFAGTCLRLLTLANALVSTARAGTSRADPLLPWRPKAFQILDHDKSVPTGARHARRSR